MKSISYKNYAVYISDRDYMTSPEEALYDKSIKSRLSLNGWHIPLVKFFDYLEKNEFENYYSCSPKINKKKYHKNV